MDLDALGIHFGILFYQSFGASLDYAFLIEPQHEACFGLRLTEGQFGTLQTSFIILLLKLIQTRSPYRVRNSVPSSESSDRRTQKGLPPQSHRRTQPEHSRVAAGTLSTPSTQRLDILYVMWRLQSEILCTCTACIQMYLLSEESPDSEAEMAIRGCAWVGILMLSPQAYVSVYCVQHGRARHPRTRRNQVLV